ncbi:metallophosphoesterase [Sporolactobacillus shoreae]|uniref:Metallophosphoesterase n=1 Tax=Sporolactobacillus shoreae TaxID=1465501 RepID=A0A4Z0GGS4_9BACL|nr:metallophosphoesterase family protein [Sporolactobacillus shoreae]TGA95831.1 metallophosphoesterase [Sporolactobacillus shoreae]
MKIAALYDIHGNFPALQAVLKELHYLQPDVIVIGGDIVSGPMPVQTLDCLLNLRRDAKVTFIRGNGDREVSEASKGLGLKNLSEQGQKTEQWVAEQLTEKHIEFLSHLKSVASIQTELGDLLFCHATPMSDSDIFTPQSNKKRLEKIFGNVEQSIVVCGHTHVQFKLKFEKKLIFNSGSIGMPYAKQTGAYWLFISPDGIQFKRTSYDLNEAAKLFRQSNSPSVEDFINNNLFHIPTEKEAMAFFNKITEK